MRAPCPSPGPGEVLVRVHAARRALGKVVIEAMPDTLTPTLAARLTAALGEAAVSTAPGRLEYLRHDVYRGGGMPLLAVRPATVAALQAAVAICAEAGVAMVSRGGGASYTDGYLYPPGGHVVFDLGGLDEIRIDEDNAVVTVGAGVTWVALRDRLAPLGLRTPFWGPFSGIAATVGGSFSQNTVSHGSAAHGASAQSALSFEVVLASGEMLTTSSSAATRHFGPDLTGLFTGDCGALGIKAAIRMPLIAARGHFAGASFAFADFKAYHAATFLAQREMLCDSQFGLDRALSQGQIARNEGWLAKLGIARNVLRAAPGLAGLKQLWRMAGAGTGDLASGRYMAHCLIEGVSRREAVDRANRLRAVMAPHGEEMAAAVPEFVHALPFAPLTNILGPKGERWVPLHGILPHRECVAFDTALQALYAGHRTKMERLGVWTGAMFNPVGPAGFLYEVALYWPGARTPYHTTTLTPAQLAEAPEHPASPEAADLADELKHEIVALFARHGAGHFQIGRAYPYLATLDPAARSLVVALKRELDPHSMMNPGALGLPVAVS